MKKLLSILITTAILPPAAPKEALQYMRTLYQKGLIDLNVFWGQDNTQNMVSGKYGTIQAPIGDAKFDVSETYDALPPMSQTNPVLYYENSEGFAFSEDLKYPDKVINALVNMMFGSTSNYLDWILGGSDTYKIDSDNTITLKYADEENKTSNIKPGIAMTLCLEILIRL